MPPRFPLRRYFPTSLPAAIGFLLNGAVRQTPWGAAFLTDPHVYALVALSLGWLFGLLYADVLQPASTLRQWWSYKTRIFEVRAILTQAETMNPSGPMRLTVLLRFLKPIAHAVLQLRVQVGPNSHVFEAEADLTKTADSDFDISVGRFVSIGPTRVEADLGDIRFAQKILRAAGPGKATITLDLHFGRWPRRRQKYSLYLDLPNLTGGTFGRFTVFGEDQLDARHFF